MADNLAITEGSGRLVAADEVVIDSVTVNAQRVKLGYGPNGTYDGDVSKNNPYPVVDSTRETYGFQTGNLQLTAAANTVTIDLFNATGSGMKVRVVGLYLHPLWAAVSGVPVQWQIITTSTVGTGGTVLAVAKFDSTFTGLPVGITARTKPTGGAATATTLPLNFNTWTEEAANPVMMGLGTDINYMKRPLTLNENEGVKLVQVTSTAAGTYNHIILFERVT